MNHILKGVLLISVAVTTNLSCTDDPENMKEKLNIPDTLMNDAEASVVNPEKDNSKFELYEFNCSDCIARCNDIETILFSDNKDSLIVTRSGSNICNRMYAGDAVISNDTLWLEVFAPKYKYLKRKNGNIDSVQNVGSRCHCYYIYEWKLGGIGTTINHVMFRGVAD